MRQLVSHTCIEEGVFNCKNIILELFNISTIWFLIFINSFKFWMPFFGDAARNKWDLSSSHNISRNNIFFLPQANTFHTADRQANFSLSKRKAHWHFQEDWVLCFKISNFLVIQKNHPILRIISNILATIIRASATSFLRPVAFFYISTTAPVLKWEENLERRLVISDKIQMKKVRFKIWKRKRYTYNILTALFYFFFVSQNLLALVTCFVRWLFWLISKQRVLNSWTRFFFGLLFTSVFATYFLCLEYNFNSWSTHLRSLSAKILRTKQ